MRNIIDKRFKRNTTISFVRDMVDTYGFLKECLSWRYQERGGEISGARFGSPRSSYQVELLELGRWINNLLLELA